MIPWLKLESLITSNNFLSKESYRIYKKNSIN